MSIAEATAAGTTVDARIRDVLTRISATHCGIPLRA